jgi:hypothetical protein
MIIDVNVSEYDKDFIDNIEDIIEDTMVQMFVLHPKDENSLQEVQELSNEHNFVFYTIPTKLIDKADAKCVGVCVKNTQELESVEDHVVMIDEADLDGVMCKALNIHKGIILNATRTHDELKNFFVSVGPGSVEKFDSDALKNLPLGKIVLQSNYPKNDFNDIYTSAELISAATFRSEMSIAAEATKNAMKLFALRKI